MLKTRCREKDLVHDAANDAYNTMLALKKCCRCQKLVFNL